MNILLVEDNKNIRTSLSEFISTLGYQVFECEHGRDALKILKEKNIHIVLSDIMMPKMDGHELLKHIKTSEKLSHIEVILITGHGDVKSAVQAMRDGAYDYLLKPVNVNELDILLKRLDEFLSLKEKNKKLTETFDKEVKKVTKHIQSELIAVRKAFAREIGTVEIGIYSKSMKEVFKTAEKLHQSPKIPVLIEGETGTGKELVAHYIHYGQGDITTPFIGLNCAAISSNLFESELFGYEAGAFTGGNPKGQKGKLELAENGTIFLDEITEMPIVHQAKLLRVIQEREYYKVGGLKGMNAEARFICATNQDPQKMVQKGTFRQDLFYRLNVGYIRIPPLRERKEAIVHLARLFLEQFKQQKKTRFEGFDLDAIKMLEEYSWPGNVRELKNMIERILLYWDDPKISPKHLDSCFQSVKSEISANGKTQGIDLNEIQLPNTGIHLDKWTLQIVQKALEKFDGNQTKTAQFLGISVRVLHTYLKKLEPSQ